MIVSISQALACPRSSPTNSSHSSEESTSSTRTLAKKQSPLSLLLQGRVASQANPTSTVFSAPSLASTTSISADQLMQEKQRYTESLDGVCVRSTLFEVKYSIDKTMPVNKNDSAESENFEKLSSSIKSLLSSLPKPSKKAIESLRELIKNSEQLSSKKDVKCAERAFNSHLEDIKLNEEVSLPKDFWEKLEGVQKNIVDSRNSLATAIKSGSNLEKEILNLVRLRRPLEKSASSTQASAEKQPLLNLLPQKVAENPAEPISTVSAVPSQLVPFDEGMELIKSSMERFEYLSECLPNVWGAQGNEWLSTFKSDDLPEYCTKENLELSINTFLSFDVISKVKKRIDSMDISDKANEYFDEEMLGGLQLDEALDALDEVSKILTGFQEAAQRNIHMGDNGIWGDRISL